MASRTCPHCGYQTESAVPACSTCGHATANGAVAGPANPPDRPVIPAEVTGWVKYQTPPDLLAWARQTCTEEEFTAALREAEQTGGLELKDLLPELEEGVSPRD
jgi:hypothetical protein